MKKEYFFSRTKPAIFFVLTLLCLSSFNLWICLFGYYKYCNSHEFLWVCLLPAYIFNEIVSKTTCLSRILTSLEIRQTCGQRYFASAAVSKAKRLSQISKRRRHKSYLDRIKASGVLIKSEHLFA